LTVRGENDFLFLAGIRVSWTTNPSGTWNIAGSGSLRERSTNCRTYVRILGSRRVTDKFTCRSGEYQNSRMATRGCGLPTVLGGMDSVSRVPTTCRSSITSSPRRFAPSPPTTSRYDPYRLLPGSSVARTSRADHVIPPIPFQDGWSALHAVFQMLGLQRQYFLPRWAQNLPDSVLPRRTSANIPTIFRTLGLQVPEKNGGDDGTRTRGLCRDRASG
jgi:hypothetical protein